MARARPDPRQGRRLLLAVDVAEQAQPGAGPEASRTASRRCIGWSRSADVFVTNFPLPVRDRLQLSPAHLLPLNPRLIYASFTAYGEEGEEAAKTGFDSTAYWARTGLMDQVRAEPSTPPARSMPGMGDHPSATGLYAAIVTALYRREKTGRGGVVRSSLLQNGLWANGCAVQTRLFGEHVPHRPTREEAPNALANHYQTRDGRWFIMALFNEQRQLRGFPVRDRARGPDRRSAFRHAGRAQAIRRRTGADPGRRSSPAATWASGARFWTASASRSASSAR